MPIEPLVDRRWTVIATFLLLAAAMVPGATRLRQDNSPENFFVADAEELVRYERFERSFGRDRGLRCVLTGPALWTREGLDWLRRLEEDAGSVTGVLGAAGLYRHHAWRFDEWPPADPARFRAEVLADPFDRNAGWVSASGDTLTVVVGTVPLASAERRRVLGGLEALAATAPAGVEVELTGLPVLSRTLDDELVRMASRLFPAVVVFATLLLWATFRRPLDVAVPLLLVAGVLVVVFGAMGTLGVALNFVTVIVAPLLFVLSLATAVHLSVGFRRFRRAGLEPRQAALETFRVKRWPIVWTGVSTGVGFGSLATSPLPTVRAVGAWSAFGIALLTLAALTVYPALLSISGRRGAGRRPAGRLDRWQPEHWGRALAAWSIRRRRAVAVFVGVTALAAAAGVARLAVSGDVLGYFAADHPVRRTIERLERSGLGVVSADLFIERREGGKAQPASLAGEEGRRLLAELTERLRGEERVLGATSVADLVASVASYLAAEALGGSEPAALARIDQRFELFRLRGFFVTADGSRGRVILSVPMLDYSGLEPLLDRAKDMAGRTFPDHAVSVTGNYPLLLTAERSLLETLELSLLITLACILAVFRGVLGGWSLTWRMLVPNLWPILVLLGGLGWLGVPIDGGTVMTASILLGLAVDDTLHTLGYFRRRARSEAPEEAAIAALGRSAGAHALTSALLVGGFGVIAFSALTPVSRFGAVSAFAVVLVLVADLVVVPALLAGVGERAAGRLAAKG